MPAGFPGSGVRGACGVRPDDGGGGTRGSGRGPLSAVSWLDWKLGARLLLEYPALAISAASRWRRGIAIGVVGVEVAGELLYKRLPFDEGGRVVRLERRRGGVAGGAEGAPRFRDLAAVAEDGGGARRGAPERAQRAHGRRRCRNAARGGDPGVCVSAHSRAAAARPTVADDDECRVRSPSWSWVTTSVSDSSSTTRGSSAT